MAIANQLVQETDPQPFVQILNSDLQLGIQELCANLQRNFTERSPRGVIFMILSLFLAYLGNLMKSRQEENARSIITDVRATGISIG